MSEQTVADWVVAQLAAWGVKQVYGVPGDTILSLIGAMEKHGGLKFYSVIHEATAAFMASAQAKLTGQVGVCVATSGPGVANLLNGLLDGKKDRAPVLALTGQAESYNVGTDFKQYVEEDLLVTAAVGFSGLVTTPPAANDLLVKAFRTALIQGMPTRLAFTKDVWTQPLKEPLRPSEPYLHTHPRSSPGVVEQALQIMNGAQKPAVLAGRGVGALGPVLLKLAEKWQSGIALTLPARGLVSGDHPLVMGGLGEGGSEASTRMLLAADLLLIVGATWWPELYLPQGIRIVQIDLVPGNIGGKIPVDHGVVGDLAELLPFYLDRLEKKDRALWQGELEGYKQAWTDEINPESTAGGAPAPPAGIMKALGETVEKQAIICLDVGDHTVWFNRHFSGSGQEVLVSGSWRSMGFGLPAALGAQLSAPGRQVVAIVGDGGLAQSLADFATAVRYHLPIKVIVVRNEYLAMEKGRMQLLGIDEQSTSLTLPDFAEFARLCGGKGFQVASAGQLAGVLAEALREKGPVIVEIKTAATISPGVISQLAREREMKERNAPAWAQ